MCYRACRGQRQAAPDRAASASDCRCHAANVGGMCSQDAACRMSWMAVYTTCLGVSSVITTSERPRRDYTESSICTCRLTVKESSSNFSILAFCFYSPPPYAFAGHEYGEQQRLVKPSACSRPCRAGETAMATRQWRAFGQAWKTSWCTISVTRPGLTRKPQ